MLDVLAYRPSHLRQERAQGTQPLASCGFARLSAEQQTQVRAQAAIDRFPECQREGSGRSYPRRNAALKLNLLSKERRTREQGYTTTDEPADPPPVHRTLLHFIPKAPFRLILFLDAE